MRDTLLDQQDKEILNIIQKGFPLEERPYRTIAHQLGQMTEEEVFERVKSMREAGYIRRLGGVFDTGKLGFKTTLVAAEVDESKLEQVAERINAYQGVTHNYQRDHAFNLWFTLAAEGEKALDARLKEIESFDGVHRLLKLPAKKLFKLRVQLPMD